MTILLLAETAGDAIAPATAKALTAAKEIGGPVHVLIVGPGLKGAAEQAAKLAGVEKVLVAEDASLDHVLAETVAALIVSLAGAYDVIIAPSTSATKNVLPRVAALLDVMQISDIIKVVSADTFERPIYAGNAIQTVRAKDAKKVITVRTTAFAAAPEGGSAPVEAIAAPADPGVSAFKSEELAKSERPELTSARIILSGGRALGSAENFQKVLDPVATRLERRDRGVSRRGRRRLCAKRPAGRPDRKGRGAGSLHRRRDFGGDPASRRHEGFEGDRGDQQG